MVEDAVISTRMSNVTAQFSVLSTYFSNSLSGEDETSDSEMSDIAENMAGLISSRIQIIDRDFTIITDTYQINRGKICITEDVNKCFNGENSAYTDEENECIIITQAITDSEGEEILYVMFATSSISDIYAAMDSINLILAAVITILVIVVIFFAVFGSYMLTKPFGAITSTINRVDEGHLEEKIDLKGASEIEEISAAFNKMLDRINQLEDSRQEFVSNVSHELKTPLTSIKVLADSLLAQDDVPVEMYREFMEDISREIDRGNAIIDDLLTLVKMDSTQMQMNISSVNINQLLEEELKTLKPLAEEKNIELVLESMRPVQADVDEVKFSMAISNIIENAIKYNNPEGWVHVFLNADQTYFYIKVQDNGIGIPEESLDKIFDRFYRVDKSRSRASGGTGLGLTISKQIILAHKGQIKVYSEEGVGTTFSVQVPLTYVS